MAGQDAEPFAGAGSSAAAANFPAIGAYSAARAQAVLHSMSAIDLRVFRVARAPSTLHYILLLCFHFTSVAFEERLAGAGICRAPNSNLSEAAGAKYAQAVNKRTFFRTSYTMRIQMAMLDMELGPAWRLRLWERFGIEVPLVERVHLLRQGEAYFDRRTARTHAYVQKKRSVQHAATVAYVRSLRAVAGGCYQTAQDLQRQIMESLQCTQQQWDKLPKGPRAKLVRACLASAWYNRLNRQKD
jgi:hypothetical protein